MTVVTLILVYIGILALSGILTWFVDDVLGNSHADTVPTVSHWVGWSVVFILIFHMANRPQYDYNIELNKNGTVTVNGQDTEELENLVNYIIEDNI